MRTRSVSFALPLLLVLSVAAMLSGGGFTGQLTGPQPMELEARIRITTSPTKTLPVGSDVVVTITGSSLNGSKVRRQGRMGLESFFEKSGGSPFVSEGELSDIGYSGKGYTGSGEYSLDISAFSINTRLHPGEYSLLTDVFYDGHKIAGTKSDFSI